MTRTVRHVTTLLAALALGLFGVAAAQDVTTFEDLDEDGDAELVAAEIDVLEDRGLYDWLDENDNEIVDEVEFQTWTFELLDVDGDGTVSETEMADGFDVLYDGDYEVTFQDFDANADAGITVDEYNAVFDGRDLLTTFDVNTDDEVGLDEFPEGAFNIADENDDGRLDASEFQDNVTLFEPVAGDLETAN